MSPQGDEPIIQEVRATDGSIVSHVTQISLVVRGDEAGQATVAEVRRLIEDVRACLPEGGHWALTGGQESPFVVAPQRPVTAPLHFRLQGLIEDYTALFAGREEEMATIEAFLCRHEGRYIFVTGESGFGKTALLANLVAKVRGPIRLQERIEPGPYLYHFLSYLRGTHRREDFLRNLCQQMMAYYQIEGHLPGRLDDLEALYARLVRLPLLRPDCPFVLVIDGIDEAADGFISNLHIPVQLPPGKFIVFSARRTGIDWLGRLGIPRERVRILTLKRLDLRGVRQLLHKGGGHAAALAEDGDFVAQVWHVSEGEPFYLRYLTEDVRGGVIGPDNIARRPQGLARYLDGWWRELSTYVREEEARQLLGLLLVARAPLPRSDILGVYPDLAWGLDGILQVSRRFIVGDGERGYALCHPRFQEYLAKRLEPVAAIHRKALLAYCARWREHWSEYALRHYAAHLAEAGNVKALRALLTREWAEARHALDGDYSGFLEDVKRAWALADKQQDVGFQIRCALVKSTIHALVTNIPSSLIVAAVKAGVLTPQAGLNYARQASKPEQRAEDLAALVPHLAGELVEEAVASLCEIREADDRIEALNIIASHLPLELQERAWREALAAAREIEYAWRHSATTLTTLVPHLPPELMSEALDAARKIGNSEWRSEALAALAPRLPQELQEHAWREALAAGCEVGDDWRRSRALDALAPHLPSDLMGEALAAARKVEYAWWRSSTLAALASHLPTELMGEALTAACEIEEAQCRSHALAVLAPHLPLELMSEALATAREIEDGRWRSETLDALFPHLPQELMGEALAAVREIGSGWWRSEALAALAPHLPPELMGKALAVAREIEYAWQRSKVLATVAPHLPPELQEHAWREALVTARAIEEEKPRSRVLAIVTYSLTKMGCYDEALSVAREIKDGEQRNKTLAALVSSLTETGHYDEAIAVAREIEVDEQRSKTLATLVFSLTEAEHYGEALAVANEIEDGEQRSNALAALSSSLAKSGIYDEALSVAHEVRYGRQRSKALAALVSSLTEAGRYDEALSVAREIEDGEQHSETLAALSSSLAKSGLYDEALSVAREVWHSRQRSEALAALAPHLPPELRERAWQEALAAAREIQDANTRSYVLTALVPRLPPDLMEEALAVARGIRNRYTRRNVLTALAPHLPPELQTQACQEALAAIREIEGGWLRGEALAALASHLPPELVEDALSTIGNINDTDARVFSLARLSSHLDLPDEQKDKIISTAVVIARHGDWLCAYIIAKLMPKHFSAQEISSAEDRLSGTRSVRGSLMAITEAEIERDESSRKTILISAIDDETFRFGYWDRVLSHWLHRIRRDSSVAHREFSTVFHRLANRPRPQLLWDITALAPIIAALGGEAAAQEAWQAIQDVTAWWP